MLIGAIPIGLIALSLYSQPIRWTPDLAGALAYNILFAGAVAQLLWFYSLCQLPAGIASIGTLATPVIGAIAASFQLGEAPSGLEAAGMVLIVSGLVFINLLDLKPIALCQYLGRTQSPSRCKEKNLPKKIARNHKKYLIIGLKAFNIFLLFVIRSEKAETSFFPGLNISLFL